VRSFFLANKHKYILFGILIMASLSSCVSTKESHNQKTNIVITQARSYIGTPYKYGGTTIMGLDCSGLLMRSFEYIGIYIPRTSTDQSKMGRAVTLDMIRPGDLVFFAGNKNSNNVTHAGLVTEVRNRDEIIFIHSSSSKGVVEANLMSNYYRKIYVKARRVKY
jgi:cell wall-associated NlpC family hydrolase